ncbi:hypothetical protein ON010_g17915 [Phytophthora cinnamomi]|nr:hypothetical protein ON010_g17915 [Phytophthora cinnamomi]
MHHRDLCCANSSDEEDEDPVTVISPRLRRTYISVFYSIDDVEFDGHMHHHAANLHDRVFNPSKRRREDNESRSSRMEDGGTAGLVRPTPKRLKTDGSQLVHGTWLHNLGTQVENGRDFLPSRTPFIETCHTFQPICWPGDNTVVLDPDDRFQRRSS